MTIIIITVQLQLQIELPVYIFGGGCDVRDENLVGYSDYASIQFDSHSPMITPRYGHAFTQDGAYVYAISGTHYESFGGSGLDTINTELTNIERYNEMGFWELLPTDDIALGDMVTLNLLIL